MPVVAVAVASRWVHLLLLLRREEVGIGLGFRDRRVVLLTACVATAAVGRGELHLLLLLGEVLLLHQLGRCLIAAHLEGAHAAAAHLLRRCVEVWVAGTLHSEYVLRAA